MVKVLLILSLAWTTTLAVVQGSAFEVATVRLNAKRQGGDGKISFDPGRFSARQATLKQLVYQAYQVPYSQIAGGPGWVDFDEFDIEARSAGPASTAQLRVMLRTLLVDRFKLKVHTLTKGSSVYVLTVGEGGSKLKAAADGLPARESSASIRFVCDLAEFADRLSTMLTIPLNPDPAQPSMAIGPPVPVLDRTGQSGIYEIAVSPRPELGDDSFTMWQRTLQEQLGLKLQAQKAQVDTLVIDSADRTALD